MAGRIYFLLFTALVSIFHQTINFEVKTEYQCAHLNFWCNSSLLRPCCDANNRCMQFSVGVSQCIIEEIQVFNSTCTVDRDCGQLQNAKCSENKQCVCKSKNIYRDNKCVPLLGGFCWHYQSCTTTNSDCIDHKCQCKNGYSQQFDNQCVPSIIGESCDDDEFCSRVKFAKCTESKKCDCAFNTIAINNISCAPILNGFCLQNADCFPHNSHCVNNKCQCTSDFIPLLSNTKCIQAFLDGHCKNDHDCMNIKGSECSINNVCSCKNNYFKFNETTCRIPITGPCLKNEDCTVINSLCVDNTCQCKPGSVSKFSNNTVCAQLLDGFCISAEHCVADNSVCVDNACQCNSFSERQGNNTCRKHLGQNCSTDRDCLHNRYAKCSMDKICVCGEKYYEFNETLCLSLLGGSCFNGEDCLVDNSYCYRGICQCNINYESFDNHECRALYLNLPCKYNDHCDIIENSICSKDKKCVCRANYSAFGMTKCLAHIGQFCRSNNDCVSKSSTVCVHNKCRCIDKFISLQSKDHCVPVILGGPCKFHEDCSTIKNAKCSANNICVCRQNYFALNEHSCGPSINESCSNDDDCMIHSSVCIDNQCQCQNNFSAVSRLQCMQNNLLFSCNVSTDCGDPWHSKCLENKKCGCTTSSILIDKSTCLPLIGGLCWIDTQCITTRESSCVDFHCRCNSNARFAADNFCSPNLFSS